MPFDNGFFPPSAVESVLRNPSIFMDYADTNSYSICMKDEVCFSRRLGIGVAFSSSSFDCIDELVNSASMDGLNAYLDSTFGYYTLDTYHKFIIAHYNWHPFAKKLAPARSVSRRTNLENIRHTLNRRIDSLFRQCEASKHILFIFDNHDQYSFMSINNDIFSLTNLGGIKEQAIA